jgi:Flp pilus assembly protein TadG
MFFLLFFAVFDFSRLFYVEMTLQNAVPAAGRYASTGNHLPDPQHQGQNLSRVNSIIQVAGRTQPALASPAYKSPA